MDRLYYYLLMPCLGYCTVWLLQVTANEGSVCVKGRAVFEVKSSDHWTRVIDAKGRYEDIYDRDSKDHPNCHIV